MDETYKFHIDNEQRPSTIPMEKLAAYMAALARLLGEESAVHFDTLEEGSTILVTKVDHHARARVLERTSQVVIGRAPKEAMRAFEELDCLLKADNAVGRLESDGGAVIIPFPGRTRPDPIRFGIIKQDGSITGQVIRVGGKEPTIPVHVQDGAVTYTGLQATREQAKDIAKHLYGATLRFHGTGHWRCSPDGAWELEKFNIGTFDVLDDSSLADVVADLRSIGFRGWIDAVDPVKALLEHRHGDGEAN